MSLEAWGDSNPYDDDYQSWAERAIDAGWINPEDYSAGAVAILNEREAQETREGWTPAHDDQYQREELLLAAVAYISRLETTKPQGPPKYWPWDANWWKPKDRRSNLIKAGALIAAEIDRLDRSAAIQP